MVQFILDLVDEKYIYLLDVQIKAKRSREELQKLLAVSPLLADLTKPTLSHLLTALVCVALRAIDIEHRNGLEKFRIVMSFRIVLGRLTSSKMNVSWANCDTSWD